MFEEIHNDYHKVNLMLQCLLYILLFHSHPILLSDDEALLGCGKIQNNRTTDLSKIEYLKTNKTFLESLKFWVMPEIKVKYKFNKFTAIIPEDLYFIIEAFKNKSLLLNRLILYGPPGNGKSSLANEIAKELNAEIIEMSGPSLVTKFQGSGVQNIQKGFEKALEFLKFNKNVVIFLDEIDAIAPNFNDDDRFHDHKAALQILWLWLDKVKTMQGIFIICATNKFEKLDKAYISRFDANIIELQNPEKQARKDIIEFYINLFNKQITKPIEINSSFINYLADRTSGLNTRTIEGIVRLIIQKATLNENIKAFEISNIIEKQRNLLSNQKNNDKNKNDIVSKIKSNLTVINVLLSVFCSGLFIYDRFIKKIRENEFWNPIIKTAKLTGMEDFAKSLKNNPEEVVKVSNALNNKAVLGYVFLSKLKEKIGSIQNILNYLPVDLGSIL